MLSFIGTYNNHKLSTENSLSPIQILYTRQDSCPNPVDIDWELFGVEDEIENEDEQIIEADNIFLPLRCPLPLDLVENFKELIQPFHYVDDVNSLEERFFIAKRVLIAMTHNY